MSVIERRFNLGEQTFAALQWPGEGEPILALHGWLDNAASFLPLAEYLTRPLVALDLSGHGHTEHRPGGSPLHFVDNVADVSAVADQLGWQRFTLMGHSMGAGIACLFAGAFPERVARLILIDGLGPLSGEPAEAATQLRKSVEQARELATKKKPLYAHKEDAIAARTRGFGGLSESASALLVERGLRVVSGGWSWRADSRLRVASAQRFSEAQVEAFLRAIQAPVCLLMGEQGMGGANLFSHRQAWLADCQAITLPGRHHLHMEEPQAVAAEIERFLCRTGEKL